MYDTDSYTQLVNRYEKERYEQRQQSLQAIKDSLNIYSMVILFKLADLVYKKKQSTPYLGAYR